MNRLTRTALPARSAGEGGFAPALAPGATGALPARGEPRALRTGGRAARGTQRAAPLLALRAGPVAPAVVVLVLLGAAPAADPDALLRAGHAAFARGDLAAAAALYEQAEQRTTDPGLVAFGLAAVRLRLAGQANYPGPLAEAAQGV